MNYANQKRVDTNFDRCSQSKLYHKGKTDPEKFLLAPNWPPLIDVMVVLNKSNEMNMWLYLQSWYGQGYFDFSPSLFQKLFSISENTCRTIRYKLEKYGFLVGKSNNLYEFVPYPENIHEEALKIVGPDLYKYYP